MKVKICKTCATENVPSNIECIKCMGDISGITPVDKDRINAAKTRDDTLSNLLENGLTELMMAVIDSDLNAVNALLRAGEDVNARDDDGLTPLMYAAAYNSHSEVITTLITAGAEINARDDVGVTPLMRAAANNPNSEVITTLIKGGAEVNAENCGVTPLMLAAVNNPNPEVITAFTKAGVDVNAKGDGGRTPLLEIAAIGRLSPKAITALAKAGADINVKDDAGLTLLMHAATNNPDPEVIKALAAAGADVNAPDDAGRRPLLCAAAKNPNSEVITALIKAGADINANNDGVTALMLAATYNPNPEVVIVLVKAGADINAKNDSDKMTPLLYAAVKNPNPDVITALVQAGANVNERDDDGRMPLFGAVIHNLNPEVITALIKAGADITAKNDKGLTPLMLAESLKRPEEIRAALINARATSSSPRRETANNATETIEENKVQELGSLQKVLSLHVDNMQKSKAQKAKCPCEELDFLQNFLVQLRAFNSICLGFDAEAAAADRSSTDKYNREHTECMLEVSNRSKKGVTNLIKKKQDALIQHESKLQALIFDEEDRHKALYAKIFETKHNNIGDVESLRDELFANEESIKQERDSSWNDYQKQYEDILENRKEQQESDKRSFNLVLPTQAALLKKYEEAKEARKRAENEKIDIEIIKFIKNFTPERVKEKHTAIYAVEPFAENYECVKLEDNPGSVKIAELVYDLQALNLGEHAKALLEKHYPSLYRHGKLCIPFCITFDDSFNYLFEVNAANRDMLINKARSLAMRLFMMIPPNKVNFTFIDPITLGETFALFTRLVDVDDRTSKIINGKIWTSAADVDERLRVLTDHIANVTQRCLQGQYDNIQEYNAVAGQNAEPYQVLMIMDFPASFKEESLRMLEQIISTGPKCGVYTVILKTEEQIAKIDSKLKPLTDNIEAKTIRFTVKENEVVLNGGDLSQNSIKFFIKDLLSADELNVVIPKLKDGIKNADKIVINFDERKEILPDKSAWFKEDCSSELVIPLGIHGANNVQNLVFGNTAYHALIIGQTGSGKSSLLHTIIMSSLVRYKADELNIFLIDFKRGVEFKVYANHRLESFRAVAIESEREFGDSVLAFLDKEQSRRAELFRRENVDNIHAYRAKTDKDGNHLLLPRILLIIDEFHVLFSRDGDTTGKSASFHLEQIIKQGRAFGVHVVLASQTMANVGGIHQSLWGQVGIRIALKCPPADAKLILSEDNDGVDLLASNEPGLAVYNSDCGNKIANTVFRIAYIGQEAQEELLTKISSDAPNPEVAFPETRVMVSNIEDNLYHPYQKFIKGDNPDEFKENAVLIGEPLQLSGKLRSAFKAKESSNLLVIGNDARKARAMFTFSSLSLAIHGLAWNSWEKLSNPCVHIMDFAPPEEDSNDALLALQTEVRGYIEYEEFEDSIELLKKLYEGLPNRGKDSKSQYLLLFGLHRARNLRQSGEPYQAAAGRDDGLGLEIGRKPSVTPYQMLLNVLKEGPQKNIHTILWVDNFKIFQAHYPGWLELFGLRVGFTMPNEDSVLFMEEPGGSHISENNAVLSYNGNQKFRPYQMPDSRWMKVICDRINSFNT